MKKESLHSRGFFDLKNKEIRIQELEALMEQPDFWQDNTVAKEIIEECKTLRQAVVPYQTLKQRFDDLKSILPEALAEGDALFLEELKGESEKIEQEITKLEVQKMLSGELDNKNCYLSINAGAGGTESCDWALMLSRMYQRWGAKKGWSVQILDVVDGDVCGIKSMTLKFEGPFAYGYAKAEKGVHRLVRISPFDSNAKRHTSFASVDVAPEITDEIQIEIKPEEVRIDTYRASGAGGQHVNKTDSAVRITHLASGIVVSCQNERSQLQNKETCYKMLKSKLYAKAVQERESLVKDLSPEKKEIAFGSQVRNYVFHPYTLVKDTRTKHETSNISAVMDGEIDEFVNTYLKESN